MVCHLNKDTSAAGEYLSFCFPLKHCQKSQLSAPDRSIGQNGANIADKQCSCSSHGEKRKVWETSSSSLKTKKVKGTHQIDSHQNGCQLHSNWNLIPDTDRNDSRLYGCSFVSANKSLVEVSLVNNCVRNEAQENRPSSMTPEALTINDIQSNKECFRIMLMNIADKTKKTQLIKVRSLHLFLFNMNNTYIHIITNCALSYYAGADHTGLYCQNASLM